MNLDDIKDQLKEQLTALWGELQENSTFNTLQEKYQSLSSSVQKALQASFGILFLLLMFYIPYSYFSSSGVLVEDFEANRQMIRSLLEASRNSKLPPPLPNAKSPTELQSQAERVLGSFPLLPDQRGPIGPLSPNPAAGLVPPQIDQAGISVRLNNLNLNQIVEIGQRLQSFDNGTKMVGIEITASQDKKNYFDVLFKIVNFSLNVAGEAEEEVRPSRGSRGNDR